MYRVTVFNFYDDVYRDSSDRLNFYFDSHSEMLNFINECIDGQGMAAVVYKEPEDDDE